MRRPPPPLLCCHQEVGAGTGQAASVVEDARIANILGGAEPALNGASLGQLSAEVRRGRQFALHSVEAFEDDERFYTVAPYCARGDFFTLVQREGRLPEQRARLFLRQMALGLRFVHAMGVAHLDVSLENLLLSDQNALLLCDYGAARHLDVDCAESGSGEAATPRHRPFRGDRQRRPGKTAYMAPEVFSGLSFDGCAADVWSMGVCLFILLLGVPPFRHPHRSDERFALILAGRIDRLLGRGRWAAWSAQPRSTSARGCCAHRRSASA